MFSRLRGSIYSRFLLLFLVFTLLYTMVFPSFVSTVNAESDPTRDSSTGTAKIPGNWNTSIFTGGDANQALHSYFNAVIPFSNDEYIAVGKCESKSTSVESSNSRFDGCIVNFDSKGMVKWSKNYDLGGVEEFHSVVQTDDNKLIVLGSTNQPSNKVIMVMYDQQGNKYHESIFDNTLISSVKQVIRTNQGDFIAVGGNQIIKFNSSGNYLKYKSFASEDISNISSVVENADGQLFVTASIKQSGTLKDASIIQLDVNLNTIKHVVFGGSNGESFRSITTASDGGVVAVGFVRKSYPNSIIVDSNDSIIVKYSKDLTLQWNKTFGGTYYDAFTSIKPTLDGGYIVAGISDSKDYDLLRLAKGSLDGILVRYNASGQYMWKKNFGGSIVDEFNDVYTTPSGKYIVVGLATSIDGDLTSQSGRVYTKATFNFIEENIGTYILEADKQILELLPNEYGAVKTLINPKELNQAVTWTSGFPAVAMVNNQGVVTLKCSALAWIRAKSIVGDAYIDIYVASTLAGASVLPSCPAVNNTSSTATPGGGGNFIVPSASSNLRVTLNGVQQTSLHTDKRTGNIIEGTLSGTALLNAVNQLSSTVMKSLRVETTQPETDLRITLDAETIRSMKSKNITFEISTNKAIYEIPLDRIDLDEMVKPWGTGIAVVWKDAIVQFDIQPSNDNLVTKFNSQVVTKNHRVMLSPVKFNLSLSYKGQAVNGQVSTPYRYMKKWIPTTLTASDISTAVRVDENGNLTHVPTKLVTQSGKTYIVIQGIDPNGVYGVIQSPKNFADITNHWAKAYINEGGSRTIIEGVGSNRFEADRSVTRAEYATMLVRGLGLQTVNSNKAFTDVKASDWFVSNVQTASQYRLINGYEDGSFRPNQAISREEAMVMLARAIRMIDYASQISGNSGSISGYRDNGTLSSWAVADVELNLKAKTIQGDENKNLRPKSPISRAETAAVIIRLLNEASLIDFE